MKTFLAPVVVTVLLVGGLGVAAWQPWASKEREQEVAWLRAYAAWSDRIDRSLERGDVSPGQNCARGYATQVGDAPDHIGEASAIARRGCAALERWFLVGSESRPEAWYDTRHEVIGQLIERHRRRVAPESSRELVRYAARLAGPAPPRVFCWPSDEWDELNEEWRLVINDELWLLGLAEKDANRIHLAPDVCEPLHRFFGSDYAPSLNDETFGLANALVVIAHEAEHLRSPEADEAAVECVAIQRVRDVVRVAGRGAAYQELMAGLAWDVGYPETPDDYRTEACHDGSDLDVRPETAVWP